MILKIKQRENGTIEQFEASDFKCDDLTSIKPILEAIARAANEHARQDGALFNATLQAVAGVSESDEEAGKEVDKKAVESGTGESDKTGQEKEKSSDTDELEAICLVIASILA